MPIEDGDRPPVERREAFESATDWLLVVAVGLVLFLIGIYTPATDWLHVPRPFGTDWVAVGVAVAGGIVLGLGASRYYEERPGGPSHRRRPPKRRRSSGVDSLGSFSVYTPEKVEGDKSGEGFST